MAITEAPRMSRGGRICYGHWNKLYWLWSRGFWVMSLLLCDLSYDF